MSPIKCKRREYWEAKDPGKLKLLLWLLIEAEEPLTYMQLRERATAVGFGSGQTFEIYQKKLLQLGAIRKDSPRGPFIINRQNDLVREVELFSSWTDSGLFSWIDRFTKGLDDLQRSLKNQPDSLETVLETALQRYVLLNLNLLGSAIHDFRYTQFITVRLMDVGTTRLLDFLRDLYLQESTREEKNRITESLQYIWGFGHLPSDTLPYFVGKLWREKPTPKPLTPEKEHKQALAAVFSLELSAALAALKKEGKLDARGQAAIDAKQDEIYRAWLSAASGVTSEEWLRIRYERLKDFCRQYV